MAMIYNNSIGALDRELQWLSEMIRYRIADYFEQSIRYPYPEAPDLSNDNSYYAEIIRHAQLDEISRLLLLVALAPHLRPSILDPFFTRNALYDRIYTEFGGLKGDKHGGFIPTGETASFIIAGSDLERRFFLQRCFEPEHVLVRRDLVSLGLTNSHEPVWSGELMVSRELIVNLTLNQPYRPMFSSSFPAKLLTTRMDWSDTVFDPYLMQDIRHIQDWVAYEQIILSEWELNRHLKRGFRALFYGPPGTGKSMVASLLGKDQGLEVYRIDLSAVVSKYIGETEKNLSRLFEQAENKKWILFFDEADALFGKRINSQSSNDMFANQQVSYMLQRIEDFNGLVILASNFKNNIDDAFLRRFQSVIYFPKPSSALRLTLWQKYFSGFDTSAIQMDRIADEYELTGGSIINVLRHCAIACAVRSSKVLLEADLIKGIRKEFLKDGITV
jgi:hypothetical protein